MTMTERPINDDSFHLFLNEKKLMGTRCKDCGTLYCPPRRICLKCESTNLVWEQVSGKGKIATFSVIPYGPMPFIKEGYGRDNPHCSGIIQLEEGPKIPAQLLGVDVKHPESIKIGTPVVVDFVERGSWHFVDDCSKIKKIYPVFKPA
jgi:uncharacterized OB-fold protein